MQLYYFSNPIRSFLKIFILIFLTGCGSYQYSSVMTDDVYENNQVSSNNGVENSIQNIDTKKSQSLYYKNAFSEKSKEYELASNENDILFTDAEQYSDANIENDSTDVKYGPWGENKTTVTINMLGGHSFNSIYGSRGNYPSWLWNGGYGYGNVFGYGLHSWGYGYDMFWTRPFHYNLHNGLFFPFWNNMSWYGYNYGGWPGYWYGNGYYNNNIFYRNTNIANVSGRRGSTSTLSGRSSTFSSRVSNNDYTKQSRISDNMINSSLRDRTSRVERLNQTVTAKPNYYSKPRNSSKPSSNWAPANNSKPRNNSKPSYNNSKPSYNSLPSYNSSPSYNNSSSSRPSFNSSSPSRGGSSSTSSRGKGGGN